eukprot:CAMPEP_0119082872 /NCGR_PEP_ID=MMETSP1178-20130426/123388_1 /TAXON_ID=33656 /ORGANISM="unid sp, Strain CCMP2000" /LENGTH=161 /DNA_ID=CAMNT_0007065687 /DNA_START=85 /DNA_END=570 /DNA_ORIENTATION=-
MGGVRKKVGPLALRRELHQQSVSPVTIVRAQPLRLHEARALVQPPRRNAGGVNVQHDRGRRRAAHGSTQLRDAAPQQRGAHAPSPEGRCHCDLHDDPRLRRAGEEQKSLRLCQRRCREGPWRRSVFGDDHTVVPLHRMLLHVVHAQPFALWEGFGLDRKQA